MEAIAVGYASALERDDIIAPFHRDMGAFLIRGFTRKTTRTGSSQTVRLIEPACLP